MTDLREEDMLVRLAVDDALTAQAAGTKFARDLGGAVSTDFTAALAEQEELIQRAITDAGFTAEQARLAAEHFEVAARAEWERIAAAGSDTQGGQA